MLLVRYLYYTLYYGDLIRVDVQNKGISRVCGRVWLTIGLHIKSSWLYIIEEFPLIEIMKKEAKRNLDSRTAFPEQ